MTARTIMVQGTASSVGKSVVTAALCRIFRQDGLRVAPFKSQNMSLNAYVTSEGGEIGRAQAMQAMAAGVRPTVFMNPILLKPEPGGGAQVVVLGRAKGSMPAIDYNSKKGELREIIAGTLGQLRASHDVVVIEGAGSPAEINLKSRDLANMFVAELADAPVLLVGDIDRGGVFAAFVGTLELLEPHERARVAAFVVNKFRGERRLLEPGLDMLRERTGVPVIGVLPYLRSLRLPDEDSLSLDDRMPRRRGSAGEIDIAVVRLPFMSNHDDFMPLEHEPGVALRFVARAEELDGADLVIVPGSKSTMADLAWLRESEIAAALVGRARRGERVLGICGGCQLLGRTLRDPHAAESAVPFAEGLHLLPIDTEFGREKRTSQVVARVATPTFLGTVDGGEVSGYEIHMGRVAREGRTAAAFALLSRNGRREDDLDGAVSADGVVVGTMVHGLFENAELRASLTATLRAQKGVPAIASAAGATDPFDELAAAVRANMDMDLLRRLVGG